MLILESINDSNFEHYKEFDEAFERDLCAFQSRIYPAENGEALLWYYLKFGETYIGSVWLEKYKPTDDYAVLGVFIAKQETWPESCKSSHK